MEHERSQTKYRLERITKSPTITFSASPWNGRVSVLNYSGQKYLFEYVKIICFQPVRCISPFCHFLMNNKMLILWPCCMEWIVKGGGDGHCWFRLNWKMELSSSSSSSALSIQTRQRTQLVHFLSTEMIPGSLHASIESKHSRRLNFKVIYIYRQQRYFIANRKIITMIHGTVCSHPTTHHPAISFV